MGCGQLLFMLHDICNYDNIRIDLFIQNNYNFFASLYDYLINHLIVNDKNRVMINKISDKINQIKLKYIMLNELVEQNN